jgi:catechol 2,3-dioxygenase-like lactoylglutathione lyase family enzyme
MVFPIGHVNELVLEVADLAAAERFYTEVLEMPVIDRWPAPREAVWVLAGNTRIGLWSPQVGIARGQGGTRVHYALSVSSTDYDDVVARIREHGARVDEVVFGDDAARSAYVADPDYNVVEFWTWDVTTGSPGAPTRATRGTFGLENVPAL